MPRGPGGVDPTAHECFFSFWVYCCCESFRCAWNVGHLAADAADTLWLVLSGLCQPDLLSAFLRPVCIHMVVCVFLPHCNSNLSHAFLGAAVCFTIYTTFDIDGKLKESKEPHLLACDSFPVGRLNIKFTCEFVPHVFIRSGLYLHFLMFAGICLVFKALKLVSSGGE